MPTDPRVIPLQRSILSVEMVPLPADVHPASYQAMVIACHHMGMPIDPSHLPRAPYPRRYYPYYQLPARSTGTHGNLRVGKGEGGSHGQTPNPTSDEKTSIEERKKATGRAYRKKMRRVKRWAEDVYRFVQNGGQESGKSSVRRR